MNPGLLAVFVVSSVDLLLAAVFSLQAKFSAAIRAYAIFAFAVALWGWGVGFFLWSSEYSGVDFFARFVYFSGGLIAPTFYYFTLSFLSKRSAGRGKKLFIFLPSFLLFFLYFFTDFIIGGSLSETGEKGFVYGPLRLVFDFHLWLFFILALRELLKKYRETPEPKIKTQIIFISLGTYMVLVVGGITNIFLPLFDYFGFVWIGPITTLIWVALVTYALLKHQLLNTKVIATEFFVALIMLAAVTEMFLSQSQNEFWRKFFVLVLGVGFFGYLLIKSVFSEVRTREEIERLAGDLAKANDELKKLDAAKSEFISLAGHQLRAPLTAIKGYSSMILEGSFGKIGSGASDAVKRVMISADQLVKMAADLLDLSRMEAGKFRYTFAPMNFQDIVKKAIESLESIAKERGVEIALVNNDNLEKIRVKADADKMHEVVVNLVDNALKYTKESPVTVTLALGKSANGQKIRLSVRDKGIGVPKEELSKLFTKFVRTEIAKKVRPEGMGLGLYFVKKIVEDHGGSVWAESDGLEKGSTFFVELPVL